MTDLTPLAGMPLETLYAPFTATQGLDAVCRIPTLKSISRLPPEEFRRQALAQKPFRDAGITWDYFKVEEDGRVVLSFSPKAAANLAALQGLPVRYLDFRECTWLEDLSPLKGLPLEGLDLGGTSIREVASLAGMPLTELRLSDTAVRDLRPLAGMRLTYLALYCAPVADITPLQGMPLQKLDLTYTAVANLRPLQGMPLSSLLISNTPVSDLTPLRGMRLWELFFTPEWITKGMGVVRRMRGIRCLGGGAISSYYILAGDFWVRYDALNKQSPRR